MKQMKDSGIEWIGQIPEEWNIWPTKRFFRHTKTLAGEQVDSYERLALTMNGVIKRSKDDSEGLQPEKFDTYQVLCENELVFKLIDLANVKTSRVGLSPYTGIVSPAYIILTNDNEDNRFYYYYFMSMYYNEIFNNLGDNGVRSSLNAQDLLNIPMVDIPSSLQKRIADFLDEKCGKIDRYIEKQQKIIDKLKEYKQAVITEAVTKGLDPDAPMKDSGIEWIGMIPEHWSSRRLRYLGTCVNGISKGGEYFGSGYPFVSYGDVYKNMELPSSVAGLVETTEDEREWYSVKEGDVFFTRTSETIEEVALTSTCMKTIENATFAGFLIRFRPNTNLLTKEFSKYYFRSDKHRLFFVKEMNLVTRASLSQELLKRLPVLLPPIDEQLTIAAHIEQKCSNIDEAINKKYAVIEKLIKYKKSLIYEAVTGKKVVE